MNPWFSRRGWPGKSSPWSRSCSTTFRPRQEREMCRRAVGHDGSYLHMSPRSGKRRSCAWRPYGAVPMPSPTCPRGMKSPDLYMSLVRRTRKPERRPREARTPEMSREAFERTHGKDKTDFSVISALSDPCPGLAGCSASRTTRSRYTG